MAPLAGLVAATTTGPDSSPKLDWLTEVKYAALGVALSVLMPFLLALVKKYWPSSTRRSWANVWDWTAPYLVLGAFSLVVAVLIAATADFESKNLALLAGFAWDKTLQTARIVWTT